MQRSCWVPPHVLAFATLVACVGAEPSLEAEPAEPSSLQVAVGYRVEVVRRQTFTVDARTWNVVLARIVRPDGGRTYVEWIPSDRPGPRPLVVTTGPYQLVDWTAEPLDARWATYQPDASGLYLDRDGPGFDGVTRIVADRRTPDEVASEQLAHLWNDMGALVVFGRFYAGGSVRDDVADMAAGMWFAANQPEVDRARIGVWGGSWGGFEALYAAQQADPSARPRAVAALYPPSDFAGMVTHALSRTGLTRELMTAYLRRIYAATGGPPSQPGTNYAGLRAADLCGRLPETLVLHDEADNLVPVQQTQALVAQCGVSALYWPRSGTIDPSVWTHGPIGEGPAPQAVGLYALTYVHQRLLPADQPWMVEVYQESSLEAHLRALYAAQLAGRDVGYAVPRLYELMDSRVYLLDLGKCAAGACAFEPGINVVARLYDRIWGPAPAAGASVASASAARPTPPGEVQLRAGLRAGLRGRRAPGPSPRAARALAAVALRGAR